MFGKVIFAVFAFALFFLIRSPESCGEEQKILRQHSLIFENNNCASIRACSLKRVEYLVQDYRIRVGGGYNFGTRLFARYQTDSLSTLEDYVFVQFIRGCVYTTERKNGVVTILRDIDRYHFEKIRIFKHAEWVIDSFDKDPAYYSIAGLPRHFAYRWNKKPGSTAKETEMIYGREWPDFPELYVADRPATAFYMNRSARNISLRFKTCIYKSRDVPFTANPNEIEFAEPINCFFWNSSFIFSHRKKMYESGNSGEIAPACRDMSEKSISKLDEVETLRENFRKIVGENIIVDENYLKWISDDAVRKIRDIEKYEKTPFKSQYLVYVDRNPAKQLIFVIFFDSLGVKIKIIGIDRVSTGTASRKGYFLTPVGFFENSLKHFGYRALGTENDDGWLGLGKKGSRVWDFGWQKTTGRKNPEFYIRFLMHATDPFYGESRLGEANSKGCVRISAKLNNFLDRYGILDKEYEEKKNLKSVSWLLRKDRLPAIFAGKYFLVGDSSN